MDAAHLLDALRTEGDAAVRGAQDRLGMPVPHLDWTIGEVTQHLGGVHQRFGRLLRRETEDWPSRESVDLPAHVESIEWARTQLAEVVAAIGAVDLGDEFLTWAGPRDGEWILRRLANETAVHRWDIEAAAGSPDDIDAELSACIIEEFLVDVIGNRGLPGVADLPSHDGVTLHLHGTDLDSAEWYLTVNGDHLDVDHRHDKGDVALRGAVSDLALWLNGRLPPSRLDAFGSSELVDWWSRAFRFD